MTEEQIEELRKAFESRLEEKGNDVVHPKDIERVKKDDSWLIRFLKHKKGNVENALNMLWETVVWRKEFKANEINDIVRMDIICLGGFFPRGRDKDGCTLFIFKCKKYVKGAHPMDELKKCLVYWFERLEREEQGKSISLFFDMEGCGLANLDLEFVKYLIALFEKYYPWFLNYLIIYEMPWVLSAAFKIIKSWLPEEATQKIKQLGKKDIKDYVPLDQALSCWGGKDDYTFSFLPESQENSVNPNMTLTQHTATNKKVHFADGSPMSDQENNSGDAKPFSDGSGLIVEPSAIITFSKEGQELVSTLELKNVDPQKIFSYKLKTTSPEKFRVRPSMGCLPPGQKAIINVTVLPGFQIKGLTKDKFLIMSTQIEEDEMSQEMSQLWKDTTGRKVNQHRLVCSQYNDLPSNGSPATGSGGFVGNDLNQNQINQLTGKIEKLLDNQMELNTSLKRTQYFLFGVMLLLIVLGIFLAYFIEKKTGHYDGQRFCSAPEQ